MKPREWKWLDVAQRLKKVGVDREAERCGTKWDNLMQQFKKVHHFQGLSGKQNFLQFSGKERLSKGFNFNMDRAVYDEIRGSTAKSHTINPMNVANTGAPGGVHLSSATFGDPECDGDGGAGHDDDEDGSTRVHGVIDHRCRSIRRGTSERHRLVVPPWSAKLRFVIVNAIVAIIATFAVFPAVSVIVFITVKGRRRQRLPARRRQRRHHRHTHHRSRDDDLNLTTRFAIAAKILTLQVIKLEVGVSCAMSSRGSGRGKSATNLAVEAATWEKKGCHVTNKKRKLVQGGSSLARYVQDEEWVPEGVASQVESDFEEEEEVSLKRKSSRPESGGLRIEDVGERRGGGGRAIMEDVIDVDVAAASRQGGGTAVAQQNRTPVPRVNDGPVVQEGVVRARTPATPRMTTATDVGVNVQAIAQGKKSRSPAVEPPAVRRSIVLPHTTIPQYKIDDESELNVAKERAFKVQTIALRVIHGWVFKLTNRQRGYHTAYGYALNHTATDIARAIWMGEDWRVCVSPMVFHITLNMDMKLPLWFVDTNIEDRHENGELAAYQEASIQRLVGAFMSVLSMAEGIDGGRVSHERLKS
ncbi:hypothetical protein CBR_g57882 [Chara braunii]|uniref:Myb/SANT-like DNA-binding domain-containing protein n=1 Tax=Chara braunii TaxID=69332 RepID=A0A388K8M0_CHABU|nr:hypothetical protein CBR_g57882 [Chara braunii]|eukprot:GBG66283.1 hypothetical protein CBR_g57882 [Chara braunii]